MTASIAEATEASLTYSFAAVIALSAVAAALLNADFALFVIADSSALLAFSRVVLASLTSSCVTLSPNPLAALNASSTAVFVSSVTLLYNELSLSLLISSRRLVAFLIASLSAVLSTVDVPPSSESPSAPPSKPLSAPPVLSELSSAYAATEPKPSFSAPGVTLPAAIRKDRIPHIKRRLSRFFPEFFSSMVIHP